jgi:hypothetical protein
MWISSGAGTRWRMDLMRTGSIMACWIIERLRCLWHGHRALPLTAAYGCALANGRIRELHFCSACDNYVWIERSPTKTEPNQAWKNLQI